MVLDAPPPYPSVSQCNDPVIYYVRMRFAFLVPLAAALAWAAGPSFELRGRILPPLRHASVDLSAVDRPFAATTLVYAGQFKFRRLPAGVYHLRAAAAHALAAQQTVEIDLKTADRKGRVEVVVRLIRSEAAVSRQNEVPYRVLALPKEAVKEYSRAQEQLGHDRREEAAAHLERAVALAPKFAEAWNALGRIAYQRHSYPDAERAFLRALGADPELENARLNLALVLIQDHRCREALPHVLAVLKNQPGDAVANSEAGASYVCLGDDSSALGYFQRALRNDPTIYTYPQLQIGAIYARRGERERALDEYIGFLRHHPGAPNADAVRAEIEKLRSGRAATAPPPDPARR